MHLGSIISGLLKGKVVVTALVSVALLGGATIAAASPAGQQVIHTALGSHATPGVDKDKDDHGTPGADDDKDDKDDHGTPRANTCPGRPEAQNLAHQFGLSSASSSHSIQTICALHDGTFKGTTSQGKSVTSTKKLGYGEIDQVLTYANHLATHATINGKLTDSNVQTFVADALNSCGSTPFMQCLQNNIPGFQPGNDENKNSTPPGDEKNGDHGHDGKPPTTPTPPAHGKPDGTPTPPASH